MVGEQIIVGTVRPIGAPENVGLGFGSLWLGNGEGVDDC